MRVDCGYGFLCLKFKGEDGLLSGFLLEEVFSTDQSVSDAIEYIEKLSPLASNAYIPHHVDRVRLASFVEYNGEY